MCDRVIIGCYYWEGNNLLFLNFNRKMAVDKMTGKIMGGMTGFAKKVTINLVYEFIDQRTKEIKDELKA